MNLRKSITKLLKKDKGINTVLMAIKIFTCKELETLSFWNKTMLTSGMRFKGAPKKIGKKETLNVL